MPARIFKIPLNGKYKKTFNNIVIKKLGEKFSKKDISFKAQNGHLVSKLHNIDLKLFQKTIKILEREHGFLKNKNPLNILRKQIENIGSYGIKGKKRIYDGYNKERKVKNRKDKEKKRVLHYYALGNNFKNEENEIPHKYKNQIICGDSELVLKNLPDNCVDLVFTSPPYNFGLDYSSNNDAKSWELYFKKLFEVFGECIRVLKYGGRIIVNVQPLFSDYIPIHHIISDYFIKQKMIWKAEILWEKNNYNCKYTAWGSWKSPSSPYLKYTWEFLEVFCKGVLKKKGESKNIDINDEEFKKWVVAKWSIAPERKMKKYGHPAMFPEELVRRGLKLFSFKNDLILDPFNGVGTTTKVAHTMNRNYLGIDNAKKYCNIAKKRITKNLFNFKK
jgi:DNA modification methylase|tara:strand:- start:1329 stop:2495 length:1167 start_codon:yes stop_codon:yes gene_type:complete